MGALKDWVAGGKQREQVGVVLLNIAHNLLKNKYQEIPFNTDWTVSKVKERVFGMMGTQIATMQLSLNGTALTNDAATLEQYGARNNMTLQVIDNDPHSLARGGGLEDVSKVKKYEISEQAYDARSNTVREAKRAERAKQSAEKRAKEAQDLKPVMDSVCELLASIVEGTSAAALQNYLTVSHEDHTFCLDCMALSLAETPQMAKGVARKIGLALEAVGEHPHISSARITGSKVLLTQKIHTEGETLEELTKRAKVGLRCEMPGKRRGEIMFVGEVFEISVAGTYWVGIKLDEPMGKHDGTAGGKRYFQTPARCAVFAKPVHVTVGDFPELDMFEDSDEDSDGDDGNLMEEL